jgi:hypothetical protein
MNFFCRLFGHTWSPATDNPKISWNTNDEGLVLTARPASDDIRFFDVCLRCREQREVQVKRHTARAANAAAGSAK